MRPADYNREKFRELVLYIAAQTADVRAFGDTKLNKALFFSDFAAYKRLGHSITGARYQKLPRGPAARALIPVRDELRAEGAIRVEEQKVGAKTARVTVAQRPARTDLFSADELAIVDNVIRMMRRMSASAVSVLSHQAPGWNLVELREDIPYSTALISTTPPPEAVRARGKEIAAQLGW